MSRESDKEKIRVRASGILARMDTILMVKLRSPNRQEPIWLPPGGSVQMGESLEKAATREFREETGIEICIKPNSLCLIHEFIEPPLHAIEFYFRVQETGGKPELGFDPEKRPEEQILLDLKFMPISRFPHENIYPVYLRENIRVVLSSDATPEESGLRKLSLRHIRTVN